MATALQIALALSTLPALLAVRAGVKSFLAERADYVRTPSAWITQNPGRAGIVGLEEIAFGAAGSRLAAWHAPSRHGAAVVLVHGTGADRSSLLFEMRLLAAAGFGVVALDLPGQGASEGRTRWGVPERQAISAAIDWLGAHDAADRLRIGGLGMSMGAYVLAQAAVLDSRLRAVALIASPNDVVEQNWLATRRWGLITQLPCHVALRAYGQSLDMKPKDVIGRIAPRAVFIVAGELDALVPAFMARQLYAAAGSPKELWIVPHAHHHDFADVAGREYPARLLDFFERTL